MLVATVLQTAALVALWVTLPQSIKSAFSRHGALQNLAAGGVLFGLAAVGAAWLSRKRAGTGLPVLAVHLFVGAIACLVVSRDLVRQIYLRPYFEIAHAPVVPQWSMFAAFALTLVVGLGFLGVVTKQMLSSLVAKSDKA